MAEMVADITTVLFDVDGTLIDSTYLHAVTWQEALRQAGHVVPARSIHRVIGMGSDQLLDELLPADRDRQADQDIRAGHGALYATFWSRLQPLPGASALLRACKQAGRRVVLASSADEREFAVLREVLDAEDAIDLGISSADVKQSKPAPDLVETALDKAQAEPGNAVFVGDTVWDVQASEKAGVRCIALLTGGIGRDELSAAGAAEIFNGPGHLLNELPDSLLGGTRRA